MSIGVNNRNQPFSSQSVRRWSLPNAPQYGANKKPGC